MVTVDAGNGLAIRPGAAAQGGEDVRPECQVIGWPGPVAAGQPYARFGQAFEVRVDPCREATPDGPVVDGEDEHADRRGP